MPRQKTDPVTQLVVDSGGLSRSPIQQTESFSANGKGHAPAHAFWLFGFSGAGKSTLGNALAAALREPGLPVLRLDGDRLRQGPCRGLGFDDADRTENLRRAAEIARLGLESGLSVIASFITPRHHHRSLVRDLVGTKGISFVHVSTELAICKTRDSNGVYAPSGTSAGDGAATRFDLPTSAEIALQIDSAQDLENATARLRDFALETLRSSTSPTAPDQFRPTSNAAMIQTLATD